MHFLSVPLTFSAANIRPNDMTAGMPAMSAIAGMAHHVERLVKGLGAKTYEHLAFALVYFSIDRDEGAPRRPPQEPAGGSMTLPSLIDIRRAHGQAALIMYFKTANDTDHSLVSELLDSGLLERSLNSELRFAGGEVFIGTSGEFGNAPLALALHSEWRDVLKSLMRAYPTQGLLIQDMSHLITEQSSKAQSGALQSMTDLLYQSRLQRNSRTSQAPATEQREAEPTQQAIEPVKTIPTAYILDDLESVNVDSLDMHELESEEASDLDPDVMEPLGTLLPNSVGFHGVCSPRGDQYFVEPVLSLVRARVLPSVMLDLNPEMQDRYQWRSHFWRWQHLPEHQLYRAVSFANN